MCVILRKYVTFNGFRVLDGTKGREGHEAKICVQASWKPVKEPAEEKTLPTMFYHYGHSGDSYSRNMH